MSTDEQDSFLGSTYRELLDGRRGLACLERKRDLMVQKLQDAAADLQQEKQGYIEVATSTERSELMLQIIAARNTISKLETSLRDMGYPVPGT